jgi:Holliday junction resolvasome RuvABC endonuclease subunit
MTEKKSTVVQGWDVSLNHAAFVELTDGELTNLWYVTDNAGSAKRSKHGFRLVVPDTKDRGQRSVSRLALLEEYISKVVLKRAPDFVGIEDYAIREEQGAHYLGEIGGIIRLLCWHRKIAMRLHDPVSVKMFVAHDGTAKKDSVERAVSERWDKDFSSYNPVPSGKKNNKGKLPTPNRRTSEDLADALAIAQMVWNEVQLRRGEILLSSLHAKEIQVYNRVTKTYPMSLLDREWIKDE